MLVEGRGKIAAHRRDDRMTHAAARAAVSGEQAHRTQHEAFSHPGDRLRRAEKPRGAGNDGKRQGMTNLHDS